MALRETQLHFKLAGGVETKIDDKAVPSVRLLDLQNGVFVKGGTVKKRYGYDALGQIIDGDSVKYTNPRQLGQRDDELLLHTDVRGYSYRPSADTWSDIGRVRSVTATETPLVRTGTEQSVPDHAINGNVMLVAWEDTNGGVWYSTLESQTLRVLVRPKQVASGGSRPRCVAVGQALHLYYADASNGRIYVCVINPSTPLSISTPIILVDDLRAANPNFDACATTATGDDPALIAWAGALGGYRVGYVHPSGVLGSPLTNLPSVATYSTDQLDQAIACGFGWIDATQYIVVAWSDNQDLIARWSFGTTPGVSQALVTLKHLDDVPQRITACWSSSKSPQGDPRLFVAADVLGSGTPTARDTHTYLTWYSTTGDQADYAYQRGLGLASRLVGTNTGALVVGVYAVTLFGTYFTLDLYDATSTTLGVTCVGRHLAGRASGLPARTALPTLTSAVMLPYRDQVPDKPGLFYASGLARLVLDTDDAQAWQSGQLGRCTYLGGSFISQYDGARWAEAGFHYAADDFEAVVTAATGSLTASGTYEWVVVYEEVNGQGELDRGPASTPVSKTLGGGDGKATLKIPTCRLTGRANARIGVFRSLNGDTSRMFRVSSLDPSATVGNNRYLANDPTVDFVTFVDAMSDTDAKTKEELYTDGGVLSNDPPACGRALTVGTQRLFFSDPFDPNIVRYSQQIDLQNGIGVELADALVIEMPPYGGAVTGLSVMDDALIVFRETAIYLVTGDGPDANPSDGAPNGFSQPRLITSDVGCSRPTSVGTTPIGLLFQSNKGIYLLGRDRQVTYVGAPVEAYNTQTVRRAVLLPNRTQILLVCDSGRTLLYDYFFQQWSTFTNHTGLGAVAIGDGVFYLRTDGRVFEETPGSYRDDNSNIPLVVVTSWVHFQDQLQGMMHVWYLHLLGSWVSSHTLQVDYQLDYRPGWNAPVFLDATKTTSTDSTDPWVGSWLGLWSGLTTDATDASEAYLDGSEYGDGAYGDGPYGGTAASAYQWRVHIAEMCESIRFRFQDRNATGAAYELTELMLTGGVMRQSLRPTPAVRSA